MPREQTLRKPTPEEEKAFAKFADMQIKAMTGAENMKKAGDYLGHKPTEKEAIDYFIAHEAENFRENYGHLAQVKKHQKK